MCEVGDRTEGGSDPTRTQGHLGITCSNKKLQEGTCCFLWLSNCHADPCNVHGQGRDPRRGDHSCWDRYHWRLCQGHLGRLGRLSLHLPLSLQLRSRDPGLNSENNRRIQRNSDIVCPFLSYFLKNFFFDQKPRE